MWQSEFGVNGLLATIVIVRNRNLKMQSAVAGYFLHKHPQWMVIGNYKPENRLEQWDIWGRKYNLLGLLDYYDLTNDKASLNAAIKFSRPFDKEKINDRMV